MNDQVVSQNSTDGHGSQAVLGPHPDDRVSELERQLATLRRALDSRDTIGMAKGILMAREFCTPDEAFDMLKRASQRTNRKLADVAAEMVLANHRPTTASGAATDSEGPRCPPGATEG